MKHSLSKIAEMSNKLSILIVDDHPLFRDGLKSHLNEQADMVVSAEAPSLAEATKLLQSQSFDVVLLDIHLKDGSGWDLLKTARSGSGKPAILIVSAYGEEEFAIQALKLGADGYINKESPVTDLLAAIRRVAAGGKYASADLIERLVLNLNNPNMLPHEALSEREFTIMRSIAMGKSLVSIAEEMYISPKTVTTYRRRMLQKLGLENNAEVTRYAMDKGLL